MNRQQFLTLWKSQRMRYFLVSFIALIASGIGYLLNVLFISKIYQFQSYDNTNFIPISSGVLIDRIELAIGELLRLFGYIESTSVISLRGIVSIAAIGMIAIIFYVCYRCYRYEKSFYAIFFWASLWIHLFIFVFTTSTLVDRYFIPVFIFALPMFGIYYQREKYQFDRRVVTFLIFACLVTATGKTVFSLATNDKNETRYEIVEKLIEEDYEFGYGSYWNANIMTELSDGELELGNLWNIESMNEFHWSSKASSYEARDGKVFLILSMDEMDQAEARGLLEDAEIIVENQDYLVLHFDSQEEFFEYKQEEVSYHE